MFRGQKKKSEMGKYEFIAVVFVAVLNDFAHHGFFYHHADRGRRNEVLLGCTGLLKVLPASRMNSEYSTTENEIFHRCHDDR